MSFSLTGAADTQPGNQELTEAQKKLVSEEQAQSLDAQENMKISGSNARHMVMQKLMRKTDVSGLFLLLAHRVKKPDILVCGLVHMTS